MRAAAARRWLRSSSGRRTVSIALVVLVVVFATIALRDTWSDVRDSLSTLRPGDLAVAEVLGLASTFGLYRAWRAILDGLHGGLGAHHARTMFFCSQVGKYVPGSVWPALIQGEIGARNHVRRSVVITSYTYALVAGVGVGGLFTAGTWLHRMPAWVTLLVAGCVVGGIGVCAAFVHPSGSQRIWSKVLGSRAPEGGLPVLGTRTTMVVLAWTAAAWAFLGLHAWVLSRPFGASDSDVVLVAGSFALAWVAGIVALPLPAGAGLREAVLVVTLGRLVGEPAAVSVALVSRLLTIVNDVVLALLAGLPRVVREVRQRQGAPEAAE